MKKKATAQKTKASKKPMRDLTTLESRSHQIRAGRGGTKRRKGRG